MERLTSCSLLKALEDCDKYAGFEVGIACSSVSAAQDIVEAFKTEIHSDRMPAWRFTQSGFMTRNTILLERRGNAFSDRSHIRVFDANNKRDFAGLSFNRVLVEDGVDEQVFQYLSGCERLRWKHGDEFTSSEELDEFLSNFKIV